MGTPSFFVTREGSGSQKGLFELSCLKLSEPGNYPLGIDVQFSFVA
jgi:hypothetical protein